LRRDKEKGRIERRIVVWDVLSEACKAIVGPMQSHC